MSTRNDFLEFKCGRILVLTMLPPSYADCFEIWGHQQPGTIRVCSDLYRNCFTFAVIFQSNNHTITDVSTVLQPTCHECIVLTQSFKLRVRRISHEYFHVCKLARSSSSLVSIVNSGVRCKQIHFVASNLR